MGPMLTRWPLSDTMSSRVQKEVDLPKERLARDGWL